MTLADAVVGVHRLALLEEAPRRREPALGEHVVARDGPPPLGQACRRPPAVGWPQYPAALMAPTDAP